MVSLFVATEKETAVQLLNDGANIYVFFGVILGLQLESMMIFLLFLRKGYAVCLQERRHIYRNQYCLSVFVQVLSINEIAISNS